MKALILTKKTGHWLLAVGCWLLAWAAQGKNLPITIGMPYSWSLPSESCACGILCPADIIVNTDPGLCTAVVNYTVTVTDPGSCTGGAYQTAGLPSGSAFPLGATVNTWNVDAFPSTLTCSFTITVVDTENPVITGCPADIAANTDPGFCDAEVFWTVPTPDDNCGVASFTNTHNPGDFFPTGATIVSYTATDAAGNNSNCNFTVTVTDLDPPGIESCLDPACTGTQVGCPFPVFVNNDPGLCEAMVNWDPVLVLDNCPGATLASSHAPGSTFPSGFTTVTYTATDAAGNVNTCNFDVFVDDIEPPVLTCPDITVNTDPGVCEAVVNFSPTATDNCGIASMSSIPASGSVFPMGTTNVLVEVFDNTGIPAFCTFNLTVEDNEAPAIANCPSNISANTDPGFCGAFVNWTPPTATDNCALNTLTASHFPPDFFPVGTTSVTYAADDFFGNASTCTFDVTVTDNEAPALAFCPADVTIATDFGICNATYTWTPPLVFDNCGITTLTSTHNPGDVFTLGTTAVTYTATDPAGNAGTCSFNVTVADFESPTILNCPANIVTTTDPGLCSAAVNWVLPTATDNCGIASFIGSNNPGDPFPTGGTFTVIYTATDNAGLVSNCFFDVTVTDNEFPVVTGCPANINTTTSATFGICAGIVSWTAPTFTDNCGIGLSGVSHINGGFFPLGTTTVNHFASDFSGNTTNCTFTITLVDNEPPEYIPCPSNYLVDTDPGVCTAVVNYPVFTIFENCGLASTTNSHNPGDAFPLGTTTVTYTATDNAGLTGSCIFDVTVTDAQAPVITGCPANIAANTDPGVCTAAVNWTAPTAGDNCGIATFTSTLAPGATFPLGTTAVIYTATDNAGLTAVCTFNVTVTDAQAPVITGCPANIAANADPGVCEAVVNWTAPTAGDNCGIATFTSTLAPGATFPLGMTAVIYTATDNAGLTAVCTFNVTVSDNQNPVITGCPANIATNADPGVCEASVNWTAPTAGDNCGIATFTSTLAPGATFPLGTTAVIYTATDNAGLTAVCTFNVTVTDAQAPVITGCPANIAANADPGICSAVVNWTAPTAGDNCGIASFTSTLAPGATFSLGTTAVIYTATDNGGLTATCTFNVTVTDAQAPVITGCPANIAANADPGVCSAVVNWAAPTAGDNCGVATFISSHLPGAVFPLGTTAVVYTATDNGGLTAVCTFNVTVTDAQAPVITGCPANIAANADPGVCTAVVNWTAPTAGDNCGIATFTSTLAPGAVFPLGMTAVIYTATDNGGLTATCTFNVTISDNQNPVITGCPANIAANADPGVCSAAVTWTAPTAGDNCGIATFTSTHAPGAVFPLGTTAVVYTATDNAGLTAACTFNVTVTDAQAPVITGCPANIAANSDPGVCSAVVNWTAPTAGDNCGIATFTSTLAPGATFPLGTTAVIYTAMDTGGLTTVCTFNVTASDAENPVITGCPANITAQVNTNTCEATVTWLLPGATDNCTLSSFVATHVPGAVFSVGTTVVTYTATDNSLNSSQCSFAVTVTDGSVIVQLNETICSGESFSIGGQSFTTTGNFQVVLTAANGCDSTVNLELTVLPTFTTNLTETICSGETFSVGGQNFTATGNFQVILTAANGCDSTVNLALTVLPTFTTNLTETICSGETFSVGGQNFTATGNFQVILTAANGCDSTVNLALTVLPTFTTNLNETICDGETFAVGGQNFTATGNFQVILTAANGCDSTVNLALTVLPTFTTNLTETICDGETFSVGGQNFTATGNFQVILTAANGCDSTVNLALTVLPTFTTNLTETICDGETFSVGGQNFTATGNFQVILTAANGCDSTVNLALTVLPTFTTNLTETICSGETFSVGGQNFTATGNFQVILMAANGCDSTVNLALTVLPTFTTNLNETICDGETFSVGGQNFTATGNFQVILTAANGCDSTVNLALTVLPTFTTNLTETICSGETFSVGGQNFTATGNFQVILTAANGCDSTVNLALTVLPTFTTNLTETICSGETFSVGGQNFTATGNFQVILTAANGCDSTVNLALTVLPTFTTNLTETICSGESFSVGGQNFTATGNFQVILTAANGCDSTVNLALTVLPTFTTNLTETICDGETFSVGGQNFTATGNFQVILTAANGCDSTVNLALTVLPTFTTNLTETICDGETFSVGGQNFTATGNFQVILTAANGCDSTVNLALTVLPTFTTNLNETICDGETFSVGGQNFTATGNFQVILTAANGCDSTVNLALTVLPTFTTNLTETICSGETFSVGGQNFTATGNFQVILTAANGCDSTVNLALTILPTFTTNLTETICDGETFAVGGQNFTTTGNFQVNLTAVNGCDSTVNLALTVLPTFTTNLTETICDGETFAVGGQNFTTTGNFQVNLTAVNGCDSTVNLALTVLPTFTTNLTETICSGETFSVGGQNFTATGNFQVNLTAVNGCDSTVNLALTVLPTFTTNLTETICSGETFSVGGQNFTATGNFQVILTAANGCDSTVNLALTVLPTFTTNLNETICDGETFSVGGQNFTTTGNFQVILTAANGCDSTVNLALTVLPTFTTNLTETICSGETFSVGGQNFTATGNFQVILTAANGCDSTVNLALTVLPTFTTNLTETICSGETFSVGGQNFTATGNFQVILTAANGCDSTVNLALTVLPTFTTNLTETICSGETFSVGGQNFTATGNFQVILTAANGCDSTVNLALTVLPTSTTNLVQTICSGETFSVGGQNFSTTGNFQVVLTAANGCDSTVNLALTVLPTFTTNLTETICSGETFSVGGQNFTATGNFQVILTAANGCDSTVNLALTVLPTFTTNLNEMICDGETFSVGGQNFTAAGNFQVILTAANGCDSTVNLALTVLPTFTTNLNETICSGESFSIGGQSFTTTGNFQVVLTAANGCDSTVNLALTVLPTFTTNLTETICSGETFSVGGQNFTTTGNFQVILTAANGCDSTVNLALTVLPTLTTNLTEQICDGQSFQIGNQSFTQSGNYSVTLTAAGGCDSVVNLALTVLPTLTTNLTEQICDGQSFQVGNQSFTQSGNYTVTLTAVGDCDSVVNLELTVLSALTTNLSEAICTGETFTVGNTTFTQSGSYSVTLTAAGGCDSVVNLALTVLPTLTTNLTEQICAGQSFQVGNQSFTQSGNYTVTLTAAGGCDSVVNLALTVLPSLTTNLSEAICSGSAFSVGNQSFSQSGNYSVPLTAAGGCDSIVNLSLNVLSVLQSSQSVALCEGDSLFLAGAFQTSAGIYFDTLTAVGGCDSILQTELTIFQNPNAMIMGPNSVCLGLSILLSAGAFDSYAWSPGGETTPGIGVTTGGSYAVTVTDGNGCTASASTVVTEENCSVVNAAFSISQDTACAMHFVQFSNQSSPPSADSELLWDFGNGSFSTEPNPYTIYPTPGTYTVTLIVTPLSGGAGGVGVDTAVQQVFVYPKIEAAFMTVVPEVCAPKSLIFNDNSTATFGLTGWIWNFGDGSAGNGTVAQHTYSNFDTVNVTHVIFDPFGCTDSINQDVVVTDLGATPPPVHLCLNLCEGDSLVVGSTVFDAQHPTGAAALISASGCDSTVTVELTFQPLETFSLGADLAICENETALLDAGAGSAFLWSNGGTNSTVSVSQSGNYMVTVSDGAGCPKVGNITVSTDTIPVEAATAGADISLCETTEITLLNAQPPFAATGFWTTFGAANLNNTANPGSAVSNLAIGENLFVWTLSNGACEGFSSDTMRVNVTAEVTETALAGEDLSFCHNVTAVELEGVFPQTTGVVGEWSQPAAQAMLGIQILEPGNPNSPISGYFPDNTYIFTWTLTNGICGAYSIDNVLVSFSDNLLPMADAGSDLNLCGGTEAQLDANLPPGTSGEWTPGDAAGTAFIADPFDPATPLSDLQPGAAAFVWTLSSDNCPAYSSDTVLVFQSEGLQANADVYFNLGQPLTSLDFLANDAVPSRENVTLTFLSTPLYGSLNANPDGTYDFTFGVDTTENIEFTYKICLKDCPDLCSQADVVILSKLPPTLPPPIQKPANVITPNGDGTAEFLRIPNYDDLPPPIEILVINRWGDVVFREKNYGNDWNGKTFNDKQLPDGTYYYILKAAGSEVSGAVTIVR